LHSKIRNSTTVVGVRDARAPLDTIIHLKLCQVL